MEQEVINELIKQTKFIGELMRLVIKLGGEPVIREMVTQMNQADYSNNWTATEIQRGIDFLKIRNMHFRKPEVLAIIEKLIYKHDLKENEVTEIFQKLEADKLKRTLNPSTHDHHDQQLFG
jgi:hypothetical protein